MAERVLLHSSVHDRLAPLPRGQICHIPTYDGSDEGTHPSVVDAVAVLGHLWHGYRYWMAFTPYPGNNAQRFRLENPSIVASHDGGQWVVPEGVRNPVVPPPGFSDLVRSLRTGISPRVLFRYLRGTILRLGYNADPALYLSRDEVMHLTYVHSLKGGGHDELLAVESSDGWRSARRRKVLLRAFREPGTFEINVPSVVDAGGSELHLYYGHVPRGGDGRPLYGEVGMRRRSGRGFAALGAATTLRVAPPPGQRLWHHEVRQHADGRIQCLGTLARREDTHWPPVLSLYRGEIRGDALIFADRPILQPSSDGWDSRCIYKASSVIQPGADGDIVRIWYSAQDAQTRRWHIGLTETRVSPGRV